MEMKIINENQILPVGSGRRNKKYDEYITAYKNLLPGQCLKIDCKDKTELMKLRLGLKSRRKKLMLIGMKIVSRELTLYVTNLPNFKGEGLR